MARATGKSTAYCGRCRLRFQPTVVGLAYFNSYTLVRAGPPGPAPSVESTRVGGRAHIAIPGNIFRTTIIAEYRAPKNGYEYEANTLTGRASLRSLPDLTGRACPDDTAGERP